MLKSTPLFFACLTVLGLHAATYYPITVNYDPGDSVVVEDFPVLLRIPAGSPIYDTAGEFSKNLRFTDSLGINCYPHETDTWNPNGESLVWIKLPQLKKNFVFRLYCEGEDTTSASNVWSAYAGVWHLAAESDSAEKDLETTTFCDTILVDGRIGVGRTHDTTHGAGPVFVSKVYDNRNGVKSPIQVTDRTVFTVSCWVKNTLGYLDTWGDNYAWKMIFGPRQANNSGWGAAWCGSNNKPQLRVENKNGDANWHYYTIPTANYTHNDWNQLVVVYNGKKQDVYMNGVLIESVSGLASDSEWSWTGWMGWGGLVGAEGDPKSEYASATDFDECRIFDGVLSANYVAADYATATQADFLTVGAAEEEQNLPEGTVAQVGTEYYDDLADAVAASKTSGNPVVLVVNGLSWTFTSEGETVTFKLNGFSFNPVNGLGDGYYIDTGYDITTDVTTCQLKKQAVVAAMRNVAVYKELHTRDLATLLPAQVAGLAADGTVVGMFDVVWDVNDITLYDQFGVTPVPGVAKVGGENHPVTAFVRATLSYSEGLHNIAQDASSMTVTAPAKGGVLIDDVNMISENSPSLITNGLPATARAGSWVEDVSGTFSNWKSGSVNPYVDVKFEWGEARSIRRIEVIARTTSNVPLENLVITADGETVAGPDLPKPNVKESAFINTQYNYRYDFTTPIEASTINVSFAQRLTDSSHMDISEVLIWSDGGPMDRLEASASADLVKLEVDGRPVALEPGKTNYNVQNAKAVTAAAGEANVAVTVLPSKEGVIRLVTMSEAGSSKTYSIVSGSPGFNIILR